MLLDTITSNEQHVRLKIYDGDLKIDDALAELLRIERAQNDALRREIRELREDFQAFSRDLRTRAVNGAAT